MSWSVQIPSYRDGQPNEVLGDDVLTAISDAQVIGLDMTGGPERQLIAAKAAARALVSVGGPMAGKHAYRIALSGHCDPGDQSTAADCVTVSVNEVRQTVAPAAPEADPTAETPAEPEPPASDTGPVDPDTGTAPGATPPTEPVVSVGETSAVESEPTATETPAEPDATPAVDTPVDLAPAAEESQPEQATPDAETPADPAQPEAPANTPVQEG